MLGVDRPDNLSGHRPVRLVPSGDADVVWEGMDDAPDRGPFRGRAEVLAHMRSWFETLDAFRSEPEEIVDAGEKVLVVHHSHGIPKGSHAEVDLRFASVSQVRDGRMVWHKQYRHRAEALEVVGLTEWTMSQGNAKRARR
jgi:ketosteroid isomerase-like protein